MGKRREGELPKAFKWGFGLAVGFMIGLILVGIITNLIPHTGLKPTSEEPQAPLEKLPLKIFVSDGISGGGVSGTAYIIDISTGTTIESITIDSSGTGTSTRYYNYSVYVYFEASGYASAPILFNPADASIISVGDQKYYEVNIVTYATPSEAEFQMLVFDETGAVLADESTGNTYNMSGTDCDFTIQLTVPKQKGLINYFDYLEGDEGEYDNLVLVISINSTLATLSEGQRVELGSTVYYIITLPDIIASKTDAEVLRKTLTLYYGGTSTLAISISFYNNVDPSIIASSLAADSDTTLSDSLATFYIS